VSPAPGPLVGLDDIRTAAGRIEGVVVRTPLLPAPELAEVSGAAEVRLKCENLQRAGAFKARGASNFLLSLGDAELGNGVITYSSGNHAQAVALAAGIRGVPAVVVMPTTAPAVKVAGARRLGARVEFEGTTSLQRMARAEAIADEEGLIMVPPFDHPWIIAGQGTVGLEIVEAWPEVDTVVVPVGGGGLAAGVSAALEGLRPGARVWGVEPVEGASMRAALEAGGPVTLDDTRSVADGLLPVRAGELTWAHLDALAEGVVTVSEEAIRCGTAFLLHRHRLVAEYSGGATSGALIEGALELAGRRVAVVVSGGNLDPSLLPELAARFDP
jgi:threonine dehydratase